MQTANTPKCGINCLIIQHVIKSFLIDRFRCIQRVIDSEGKLLGIVHLNNIRHVIFEPELYDTTYVSNLMYYPQNTVSTDDLMEDVVEKFEKSKHFNLPVIQDGKYIGFVSRANVFARYRKMLKHFSED